MTKITPLSTSLITLDFDYKKEETLLESPELLPTSKPSTPQVSYVVTKSSLPLSSPCYKMVLIAYLIVAGKYVTSGNLNFDMRRNNNPVYGGGFAISANTFYTLNCYFYNVQVNDTLSLYLWSNQTDSNWDYKALQVQVSQLNPLKRTKVLSDVTYTFGYQPVLTLGNPVYDQKAITLWHEDQSIPVVTSWSFLCPKTKGLFSVSGGDVSNRNQIVLKTSYSSRPFYSQNQVPTQIKFRGLGIEGQP